MAMILEQFQPTDELLAMEPESLRELLDMTIDGQLTELRALEEYTFGTPTELTPELLDIMEAFRHEVGAAERIVPDVRAIDGYELSKLLAIWLMDYETACASGDEKLIEQQWRKVLSQADVINHQRRLGDIVRHGEPAYGTLLKHATHVAGKPFETPLRWQSVFASINPWTGAPIGERARYVMADMGDGRKLTINREATPTGPQGEFWRITATFPTNAEHAFRRLELRKSLIYGNVFEGALVDPKGNYLSSDPTSEADIQLLIDLIQEAVAICPERQAAFMTEWTPEKEAAFIAEIEANRYQK